MYQKIFSYTISYLIDIFHMSIYFLSTYSFKKSFKMNSLYINTSMLKHALLFRNNSTSIWCIFLCPSNIYFWLGNISPKQKYEPAAAVVGWLFVWHGAQETAWQIPWLQGCPQDKLWCNHEPHKEIPLLSGKKQMWELEQEERFNCENSVKNVKESNAMQWTRAFQYQLFNKRL